MADSYIQTVAGSTVFVGPDATRLFAAAALREAIRLYLRTGMRANRACTPGNLALATTRITNKSYPRGKRGLGLCVADLTIWIDTMKAAMPVKRPSDVPFSNPGFVD